MRDVPECPKSPANTAGPTAWPCRNEVRVTGCMEGNEREEIVTKFLLQLMTNLFSDILGIVESTNSYNRNLLACLFIMQSWSGSGYNEVMSELLQVRIQE